MFKKPVFYTYKTTAIHCELGKIKYTWEGRRENREILYIYFDTISWENFRVSLQVAGLRLTLKSSNISTRNNVP